MAEHRHRVVIPRPERIRRIDQVTFGWVDAAFWRDGWMQRLTPDEVAVYLFLCLVADRNGVSFYRRDRLAERLGVDFPAVDHALSRLRALDLVAFEAFGPHVPDGFHQVLSLPSGGPPKSPLPLSDLWQPRSV